jgi:hypothetical protein
MSGMPFDQIYQCEDDTDINLRKLLDDHYDGVMGLQAGGLFKATESFGFAMAAPRIGNITNLNKVWDDADQFVWFVGGWGDQRERYIANAIRKMRALLRLDEYHLQWPSTLDIRLKGGQHHFRDIVDSVDEDGNYPWGDFPWGGATIVHMGDLVLVGAVSALSEIEDDFVARLILGSIAKRIVIGDNMLTDD